MRIVEGRGGRENVSERERERIEFPCLSYESPEIVTSTFQNSSTLVLVMVPYGSVYVRLTYPVISFDERLSSDLVSRPYWVSSFSSTYCRRGRGLSCRYVRCYSRSSNRT